MGQAWDRMTVVRSLIGRLSVIGGGTFQPFGIAGGRAGLRSAK